MRKFTVSIPVPELKTRERFGALKTKTSEKVTEAQNAYNLKKVQRALAVLDEMKDQVTVEVVHEDDVEIVVDFLPAKA